MNCHCGSGNSFESCCQLFISQQAVPKTAEELMRSRYSAYVELAIDYLIDTTHTTTRKNYKRKEIEQWAKQSEWQKLDVLSTQQGLTLDEVGFVEFKAHYASNGINHIHHEKSLFRKENNRWYYVSGETPKSEKNQRNAPCSCGSGKKFKRCCGSNN